MYGRRKPFQRGDYLKGIDFPAKKNDLVKHARKNKAGEDVIGMLKQMPEHEYGNMADVMKGYGETT